MSEAISRFKSFNAEGRRKAVSQALSQRAAEENFNKGKRTVPVIAVFFHHRGTEDTEKDFSQGETQFLQKR